MERLPDRAVPSTSTVIRGALGIFTGRTGSAARARGDIRISAGRIVEIGDLVPQANEEVLDAAGCVVYPGLISTHGHLFQSSLKGVPAAIDSRLEQWLIEVPYRHWRRFDAEAIEISATIGIAEMLLSGTTTVADHHFLFTDADDTDAAAIIFDVATRLGVRMVLCRGGATNDRRPDLPAGAEPLPAQSLDTVVRHVADLAKRFHDPAADAMRRIVFAPTTAPFSVNEGDLRTIADAARDMKLRLHCHLSETASTVEYCRERFGERPVAWMARQGWLGSDVWFAHLVHADDTELRMLAESSTGMAHCPQSNCRLGSGIAPATRFAAMGGRVSLGVDGAASNEAADMASEMHCAWQIHRALGGPDTISVEDVVHWATAGGADVLGLGDVGTIEVGRVADLAVFELEGPRYFGLHDPLVGPVAGGGGVQLRYVLVNGRPVVRHGKIPNLDLNELAQRSAELVRRLDQSAVPAKG